MPTLMSLLSVREAPGDQGFWLSLLHFCVCVGLRYANPTYAYYAYRVMAVWGIRRALSRFAFRAG